MEGERDKEEGVEVNQSSVISDSAEEERREENNDVLGFLDSVDSYLLLIDSLSSTLRQGWLELASARYSMGASRINTALLDHKDHPAATSLEVNHRAGSVMQSPQFTLHKWTSPDNAKSPFGEPQHSMDGSCTPVGNTPESHRCESNGSSRAIDNSVQKERSKLLSMFGTLVSPKLRSSQLSFESALETLVELANMRSSMLLAYDKVKKEIESTIKIDHFTSENGQDFPSNKKFLRLRYPHPFFTDSTNFNKRDLTPYYFSCSKLLRCVKMDL